MASDDDTPREFTDQELQAALKLATRKARDQAFAAGLSVPFIYADRMLLRFADGHIEDIGAVDEIDAVESIGDSSDE